MKLICIINGVSSSGGAEHVMCTICNDMVRRGHDVVLLTQEPEISPAYDLDKKVVMCDTHVSCRIPIIRNFIRNIRLHKAIKSSDCDVALSFMIGMNLQAIVASFFTGVPLIVSERIDPKVYDKTLTGFIRSVLYPRAAGFVFQTDEAQAYFSKGIQERSVVIPNPLFGNLAEKQSYKASGRIVAVGRMMSQKNYPFMLKVFAEFSREFPDYTLEIYGKGPLEGQLKQQTVDLGIAEKVRFMGVCSDLTHKIEGADMFLMTSDYEGLSNALAEALAVGLPCVATDCSGGGASYLIEDGKNGVLVDIGDSDKFISAMKCLAGSIEKREQLGTAAKDMRKRLSCERICNKWEDYLKTRGKNHAM